MYNNGYDCIYVCSFEYGENKECSDCTYFKENELEMEIDRELEIMEKNICKCECDFEGELFSNDNFKR